MTEVELVQLLADGNRRLEAMTSLIGGVTATELRSAKLSEATFRALVDGLSDTNPRVRWWCVQLLDHVPDRRAIAAIVETLDDPVPRVRRNAAHALGCLACKPGWSGQFPPAAASKLASMAASDPNTKVRSEAQQTILCRSTASPHTPR